MRTTRRGIVGVLLAWSFTLAATQPAAAQGNIVNLAQYENIGEPLLRNGTIYLQWSPLTSHLSFAVLEGWNTVYTSFLTAQERKRIDAEARAITTETVKRFRISLESAVHGARNAIAKLRADMAYIEDTAPNGPRYKFPGYTPVDRREQTWYDRYHAIDDFLTEGWTGDGGDGTSLDEVLEARFRGVQSALLHVLGRLTREDVTYAMTSLDTDRSFLSDSLKPFYEVVKFIEDGSLELTDGGKTPRVQFRANLTNRSRDLVYFLQVLSRGSGGEWVVRPDTRYPAILYPNPHYEEGSPVDSLRPTTMWLPVGVDDKLVMRAATFGDVRRRIRGLHVAGNYVRPDLMSLSRGFYYFGYEADRSDGAVIVSRWYPIEESYTWTWERGTEWASEPPELRDTDGRTLRRFGPDLVLRRDRAEWRLPLGVEDRDTADLATSATIEGRTTYLKVGPNAGDKDPVEETGSGELALFVERW